MITWVDYAILGVLAASMLMSIYRGFVRELLSIVAWVAAFFVSFQFSQSFAETLGPWIASTTFRHMLAFMLLFSGTLLIGSAISNLIVRLLRKSGVNFTDRLLGVFFGFARGVLLVSLALMVVSFTELTVTKPWSRSSLVPTFQPILVWMSAQLPSDLRKTVSDKAESITKKAQLLEPDALKEKESGATF